MNIYTSKIDVEHGYLISIGNNVTISHARLLVHDASTKLFIGYTKIGRIEIGDYVFIGADAIVLPNVKIGDHVIVAAGAVVSKDVPSNSVVAGNPAKVIRSFDSFIEKNKLLMNKSKVFNCSSEDKSNDIYEYLKDGGFAFDI